MTAVTDRVHLAPEDAARDARQRTDWEDRAAWYETQGLPGLADRFRTLNTPEGRADARDYADSLPGQRAEPDWEKQAAERREGTEVGLEDPWAYDRPGMHGGAA